MGGGATAASDEARLAEDARHSLELSEARAAADEAKSDLRAANAQVKELTAALAAATRAERPAALNLAEVASPEAAPPKPREAGRGAPRREGCAEAGEEPAQRPRASPEGAAGRSVRHAAGMEGNDAGARRGADGGAEGRQLHEMMHKVRQTLEAHVSNLNEQAAQVQAQYLHIREAEAAARQLSGKGGADDAEAPRQRVARDPLPFGREALGDVSKRAVPPTNTNLPIHDALHSISAELQTLLGAIRVGATDPTGFRPAAAADALGRYAAIRAAGGFPPPRGGRSAELGRVQN